MGTLFDDSRVEIGSHVLVGTFCNIGWARIEDYVMLASGVHVMCGRKAHFYDRTDIPIALQGGSNTQVRVGYGTWVGSKAIIMADVGEECVIGAGAVVTKPIPSWSIAAGVPARVVGSRKPNKQVNSLLNQEYTRTLSSGIPTTLIATLAEAKETTETLRRLRFINNILPTHLFEDLLRQLLERICQAFAVDTITLLMLAEEDRQNLYVRATIGLEEEIAQKIRIPVGRGFAGSIAASLEPMIVDDLSKIEVVSPILRNKGLKSMVGVPLLAAGQVVGVFHLGAISPHRFTKDDVLQLELFADCIASVMLIQDLHKCSYHQGIFGLRLTKHYPVLKSLVNCFGHIKDDNAIACTDSYC